MMLSLREPRYKWGTYELKNIQTKKTAEAVFFAIVAISAQVFFEGEQPFVRLQKILGR